MDVREKLVELLCQATFGVNKQTIPSYLPPSAIAEVADHLISHGVTVQEWISVKDRLPEDRQITLCFKKGKYDSCVMTASYSKCLESYCDVDFHGVKHGGFFNYDSEVGYYELSDITHWMPLPQPPKGE